MTPPEENGSRKHFISDVLPWLVAGVALAAYLLTINHWVSMASLSTVANLSGWMWQPSVDAPLFWLVTLPLRLLSPKVIPLALNLLAAICAALTLKMLARSVALLPHDRTEEQRLREKSPFALLSIRTAWLPPVLAAVLCGLQLTFWQNATVASREMFDLLLFAYVIRCVLEFRVSRNDSWLVCASLVYGAAMAENWAMIGFFPLFLIALVWLKGISFFESRFLSRMFIFGCAGLAVYLLLPLVQSFSSVVPVTFWQALKYNLASQKRMLMALPFSRWALIHGFNGDQPLWVLALPSLLPILALSVKWPSYFGDTSKLGIAMATFIFHILHAVLFVLCVWVMLDPEKFSPRHLLPDLPFLTLYYLCALSVGYYLGYLLLVFGTKPRARMPRPVPAYQAAVNFLVNSLVFLVVLAAPAILIYRNLPQIRTTNGLMWRQFADRLVEPLSREGGVMMSDNSAHLYLAQAALARRGGYNSYMFLDTLSLRDRPLYHKWLARRFAGRWPAIVPPLVTDGPDLGKVDDGYLVGLAMKMAETNSIYYLHPSFGYYFELFYPEAHGLVYKLRQYQPNVISAPACTAEQRAENERFWSEADVAALQPLLKWVQTTPAHVRKNRMDEVLEDLHLVREPNSEVTSLAWLYSRALDQWGVEMQRGGFLAEAAAHFNRALDLNPDNVVAQVNLECNKSLQAGTKAVIDLPKSAEERLGRYRTLENVMNANGPFDEPTFCFQQGRAFLRGGNFRQAGQELIRVKELVPDNLPCRLLLAQIYLFTQMPDKALSLLDEFHRLIGNKELDRTNQMELLVVETRARLAKGDLPGADATIEKVLQKNPKDEMVLEFACREYMNFGCYTNALTFFDRQLKLAPNNPAALINKGVALLRLNRFDESVASLSQAANLETTNFSSFHYAALINRAVAYLHLDKLEQSKKDYEEVQRMNPGDYRVDFGLADIAYRQHSNNAAIHFYENYLRNAPTNSPQLQGETARVAARLRELKSGAAAPEPEPQSNSVPAAVKGLSSQK